MRQLLDTCSRSFRMRSVETRSHQYQWHADPAIEALLSACPFLARRVDLSDEPYCIAGRVATLLCDGELSDAETDCVFAHLNKMAEGDEDTQELLMIGIFEVLIDSPQLIAAAREKLQAPARALFERVLDWWEEFGRSSKFKR
jgi:hypothetical protein